MIRALSSGAQKLRSNRWWLVSAALLLTGALCLTAGLRQHHHPLAGPVSSDSAPPSTTSGTSPPSEVVARSVPLSLSIPAIGVAVPLSELGLNLDGTVEVPTDVQEPGWFQLGPSPGQLGSAVILGHVDSYQGPGVFFRLRSLQAGDPVMVSLSNGSTAHFVVNTVVMYSKAQFPDEQVYGSHGYSGLQLVTCGGTFDAQTGHYLSNIVVYTSLVAIVPPSVVTGTGPGGNGPG